MVLDSFVTPLIVITLAIIGIILVIYKMMPATETAKTSAGAALSPLFTAGRADQRVSPQVASASPSLSVVIPPEALGLDVALPKVQRKEQAAQLMAALGHGLAGAEADLASLEPARGLAVALAFDAGRLVIVRAFGQIPPRLYHPRQLVGIEVFLDDQLVARSLLGAPSRRIDQLNPNPSRVMVRLILDDPAHPDFELLLWDPSDKGSVLAEGPQVAFLTARRWLAHGEAIIRRVNGFGAIGPQDTNPQILLSQATSPQAQPAPTVPSSETKTKHAEQTAERIIATLIPFTETGDGNSPQNPPKAP